MSALHPLPMAYIEGATHEQRQAFFEALAARYPAGGEVCILPACGAAQGELGPVCIESSGHAGDHIARDPVTGLEVSRW